MAETGDDVIEYFYAAHSAFAYLGAGELARIARDSGWRVVHRPMDLAAVMAAIASPAFATRPAAQMKYFFGRELVRWAEWRGLPMIRHRPVHHDAPLDLAHGMILAAGDDADAFSRAVLAAHWQEDADLSDRARLLALAEEAGLNGAALLAAAESPAIEDARRAITDEAIARGVPGSPTYFVRGDMFYGQDRLEMVERAIACPFGV